MKKFPDRYVYPAVLTYEEGNDIAITFPDLPGCATCAENEAEVLHMAQDALGGHLYCMEEDGEEIPEASSLAEAKTGENERGILVEVYMPAVRLACANKSVNRTVTLPAWMNAAALGKGINFSQVLQEALRAKLGL